MPSLRIEYCMKYSRLYNKIANPEQGIIQIKNTCCYMTDAPRPAHHFYTLCVVFGDTYLQLCH